MESFATRGVYRCIKEVSSCVVFVGNVGEFRGAELAGSADLDTPP